MLDYVPLVIALVGLVLYTVLGGADFGAGFWQLVAGPGDRGRQIRDRAHRSMGPVWEANHVWLVLVLTVLWTGYPPYFGSVFSTLAVPLFLAALGIVARGLTYALHAATRVPRERRIIDMTFCVSSVLTPFMLGTVVGALAAGRVPVGNAAGDPWTSWTSGTSVISGVLAVAVGAFLAAVFLAADARRFLQGSFLAEAFRVRACGAGVACGVIALAALPVADHDAPAFYHGLTTGLGLAAVVVSGVAGLAALVLVWARRYDWARVVSAAAVAALIGGWAAAQRPDLLPGLSVREAAADDSTLIALTAAVGAGAVLLFPSLGYLIRLTLTGRLAADRRVPAPVSPARPDARRPRWAGRAALACFVAGAALLVFADNGASHVVGVIAFAAAALLAYTAIGPDQLATREPQGHPAPPPATPPPATPPPRPTPAAWRAPPPRRPHPTPLTPPHPDPPQRRGGRRRPGGPTPPP